MCLYANRSKTKKLEKRFNDVKSGWIKMYKLVSFPSAWRGKKTKVFSPYMQYQWSVGKHQSGLNGPKDVFARSYLDHYGKYTGWGGRVSTRPLKRLPYYGRNEIHESFHVYTSKARAKRVFNPSYVILPVWVHKRDFVAAGCDGDAAFLNVTVRKGDYDKATEDAKKKRKKRQARDDARHKGR